MWSWSKSFGLTWDESNIVGAGMVSRGEMALVVANVALNAHVVDQKSLYCHDNCNRNHNFDCSTNFKILYTKNRKRRSLRKNQIN